MRLGDWYNSWALRRLLLTECARIRRRSWQTHLVRECVYAVCKEELDSLLAFYWSHIPERYRPKTDGRGMRQRQKRKVLILRSFMACGKSQCGRRVKEGLDRLVGYCEGCENRLYAFEAGGDARPLVKKYAWRTVKRLIVSAVLEAAVVPALGRALDVKISDEVLPGCTLYVLAQEIGWLPQSVGIRLSSDLAILLVQALGADADGNRVNPKSLGAGPWLLSDLYSHVERYASPPPEPTAISEDWPRFKDEWKALGNRLISSHANKFYRRQGNEGG